MVTSSSGFGGRVAANEGDIDAMSTTLWQSAGQHGDMSMDLRRQGEFVYDSSPDGYGWEVSQVVGQETAQQLNTWDVQTNQGQGIRSGGDHLLDAVPQSISALYGMIGR